MLFGFEEGDDSGPTHVAHPPRRRGARPPGDGGLTSWHGHHRSGRVPAAGGRWLVQGRRGDRPGLTDDPSRAGRLVTTDDVTERARAQALVSDQARILRLIAEGAPLTETLTTICEVVERQVPGAVCSVMLVDEAERAWRRTAWHRACRPSTRGSWTGCRSSRTRVRAGPRRSTARPSWPTTSAPIPGGTRTCSVVAEHGLQSCWSTPVMASSGDRVLGTFGVSPHAPGTDGERRGDRRDREPARRDRDRAQDVRGPARAPGACTTR